MRRIYSAALGLTLSLGFCLTGLLQSSDSVADIQVASLVEGNSRFAFDFYKKVRSKKGNICLSPYSISTVFAMTATGAKDATAVQMLEVLHYSPEAFSSGAELQRKLMTPPKADHTELVFANSIWVEKEFPILPSFQSAVEKNFAAPFESVDFSRKPADAVQRINQWVDLHTKGKINKLFSDQDITSDTRMVLASAIYLRGEWSDPFDRNDTAKEAFYLDQSRSVNLDMMHNTESFRLFKDQEIALIELPYMHSSSKGPALSMVIVLPNSREGLAAIENKLSFTLWKSWLERTKFRRVELSLPKFKIEETVQLNDVMVTLGMKQAFSMDADFSGITGHKNLYISDAVHKTFITVDEKGTEAAAATGVTMNLTSLLEPVELYQFVADHPFLYFIVDKKTGSILFMGRFIQPE